MFNRVFNGRQRRSDEAEKPFWISYADLMTAMMVLFLVVMVASLSSVTQRIQQAEAGEKSRGHDIARLCEKLELQAKISTRRFRLTAMITVSALVKQGVLSTIASRLTPKDYRRYRMWCR